MPSNKPIRIIDISRKLNLATATIIDFLEKRSYPVDRSHHTQLTADILDEIKVEFGSGKFHTVLSEYEKSAEVWEKENLLTVDRIKTKWKNRAEKMRLKQERSQRVIEGREKSRIMREIRHDETKKYDSVMQSVRTSMDGFDGRIQVTHLQLEIIRLALALNETHKNNLLNLLHKIDESL